MTLRLNHTLYAFLNYYIDAEIIGGKWAIYRGEQIAFSKPTDDWTRMDLIALRVLSIEQNIPVCLDKFRPLTNDLNVEIFSLMIINGVLHVALTPKIGAKRIKVARQMKAALARMLRIYPYSEFEGDIEVSYIG